MKTSGRPSLSRRTGTHAGKGDLEIVVGDHRELVNRGVVHQCVTGNALV